MASGAGSIIADDKTPNLCSDAVGRPVPSRRGLAG